MAQHKIQDMAPGLERSNTCHRGRQQLWVVGTGTDGQEADVTAPPTSGHLMGSPVSSQTFKGAALNLPSRHFREIKVGTFTGAVIEGKT